MNIFHKVALQGLKKNRTRTFVTVIGVALSATLFTTVATFGTSLLQYLINGSIARCGNWYIDFADVDSSFVQERISDSQVTDTVVFENIGYALLNGAKSVEKPYLFIAGFTDEAFEQLPVTLISGRLPQNDTEVIIPNHVSIKADVRIPVGETLRLSVGSRAADGNILTQHDPYNPGEMLDIVGEKTYTVVGTYERAGFEEHDSPGYTVITRTNFSNTTGRYSLFITLDGPQKVNAYADRFADSVPFVLNEDVLRFYGVSENTLFNVIMFAVGGILTAIIMIGSVFLIYNSFNISLNERVHQFGILMSVGATARQLKSSVLFEGLCIGVLGIPFGVAAGIGSVALVLPIVEKNFATISASNVPLGLSVSVPALAAAIAVSMITILISAYIPARKAAAVPVMDCIRQTGEIKTQAKDVKTSGFVGCVYGLEGMLALKNFRRNKRRYRSVILSLTLSVVLFVTGNAFGSTLKGIAKELTVEADGDISLYAQEMSGDELLTLYDRLRNVDGVSKGTWQANVLYSGTVSGLSDDFVSGYLQNVDGDNAGEVLEIPIYAQFIEDTVYYDFIESLEVDEREYSGQDAKVLALIIDTLEHKTFFMGKEMEVAIYSPTEEQTKTVCTTVVDNYPLDMLPFDSTPQYLFMMVIPWSMHAGFDGLGEASKSGLTFWTDTPTQTMARIQSEILDSGLTCDYTLINLSSAFELLRSLTFVVDVFTYAFVAMISLIAVANVFNTISTNIRIRRRELAMLRSIGMSERGFNRMMNFECFFYGLRTFLFGVPVAGILSWLIYKGMAASEQLEGFAYHFPWKSMTVSILGVFCIVFITMLYATSKVRKENIIDALRDDMA
ncbi:MAG: FtsX-like permease family protein [Lachnospiraceae bacterium]|nr:FtsX-like permease family protein [Lachnospiraceae bacterium]